MLAIPRPSKTWRWRILAHFDDIACYLGYEEVAAVRKKSRNRAVYPERRAVFSKPRGAVDVISTPSPCIFAQE